MLAGLQSWTSDQPTVQVAAQDAGTRPVLDEFPSRVDMQRMRAYMLHHAQHTSMYQQPGTVPFVKVAAFQSP